MGLFSRARKLIDAAEAAVTPAAEESADKEAELAAMRERVALLERVNGEYFDVIESMEKQRDEWKDMFFTQSGEHQNAQGLLQKLLAECSGHLRGALNQLNFLREAAGFELVTEPKMLASMPTDLPEQYGQKIKELSEKVRAQTNGKTERARIAAGVSAR